VPYSYQSFSGGAAGINLAVSIPFLLRSHVSLYTNYDQSLGTYDTLLVEGSVEATMKSRVIEIAEIGAFKGEAEIDMAESNCAERPASSIAAGRV
jgi:hypothetical protein